MNITSPNIYIPLDAIKMPKELGCCDMWKYKNKIYIAPLAPDNTMVDFLPLDDFLSKPGWTPESQKQWDEEHDIDGYDA